MYFRETKNLTINVSVPMKVPNVQPYAPKTYKIKVLGESNVVSILTGFSEFVNL